jgi:hypothetical protein
MTMRASVTVDFMGVKIPVFGTFQRLLADHALGQEIGKGLAHLEIPKISHYPCVKAGVEEMKNGMLNPADILVHGHPVVHSLRIHRALIKIGTGIAIKIPGRLNKGIHRVRLSSGRAFTLWT